MGYRKINRYIFRNFVLSIECKAYAELAMYKRVIVDCYIMHSAFPELKFCLFLLESQLGRRLLNRNTSERESSSQSYKQLFPAHKT